MADSVKKFHILVVDDEPAIRNEFLRVLSPAKHESTAELGRLEQRLFGNTDLATNDLEPEYELTLCSQGDEAVEAVHKAIEADTPFSVVFLDIRMPPGHDGVWTAEHIRELDPHVHIVMVTAYSDIAPLDIAKRVRPPEQLLYVQKPFYPEEIQQSALALSAKWHAERELSLRNIELSEVNGRLARANEALHEADRLKTEFVITISHELRTPLTIFKNVISNASEGVFGKIPESLKKNLAAADEGIDRLAGTITDFIDLDDMDSDRIELNRAPTQLQPLVNTVVKKLAAKASSKAITLKGNSTDANITAPVDSKRLLKALTEVVDNAIKFADENTAVSISVRQTENAVEFVVDDTGAQIEPNDIARVFNRFVQVHKQVGPGRHGTGLGLTIAKSIVELHGGRIWLECTPAKGTQCHFTIPLSPQATTVEATVEPQVLLRTSA